MHRRRLLAAAGLAAAGPLAGCGRFGGGTETETETPTGQWELRGTVVNEDDGPREWLVEVRSESGAASASGTVPGGERWEFGLGGMVRDEELEVFAESDSGAQTARWQPTACRQLGAQVSITDGMPALQVECTDEDGS